MRAIGTIFLGAGTAAATAATPDRDAFQVTQGDETFAVEPLSGDEPVEQFYDFRLPEQYTGVGSTDSNAGPYFESVGTADLQRESTTISFLYDGPNGLSLVVVHDKSTDGGDGGAVTWDVVVRPADVEWVVKDDYYEDEDGERPWSNFDIWDTDGAKHRIDWTWSATATDGGALGYLRDQTTIEIHPSFNEAASLYEEYYEGDVTDWEFLSGDVDDPERTSLALDEPVTITGTKGGPPADVPADSGGNGNGRREDGNSDEKGKDDETEREDEEAGDSDEKRGNGKGRDGGRDNGRGKGGNGGGKGRGRERGKGGGRGRGSGR